LAVLLRENSRRKDSHVIFSDDEGKTWSKPRELPLALTGDRHIGRHAADGRLFISFRCNSPIVATTYGHWKSGEAPYIQSVRFKLSQFDKIANE